MSYIDFCLSVKLPKLDDPQKFCRDHTVSVQAPARCPGVLAAQDGLENLLSPIAMKPHLKRLHHMDLVPDPAPPKIPVGFRRLWTGLHVLSAEEQVSGVRD